MFTLIFELSAYGGLWDDMKKGVSDAVEDTKKAFEGDKSDESTTNAESENSPSQTTQSTESESEEPSFTGEVTFWGITWGDSIATASEKIKKKRGDMRISKKISCIKIPVEKEKHLRSLGAGKFEKEALIAWGHAKWKPDKTNPVYLANYVNFRIPAGDSESTIKGGTICWSKATSKMLTATFKYKRSFSGGKWSNEKELFTDSFNKKYGKMLKKDSKTPGLCKWGNKNNALLLESDSITYVNYDNIAEIIKASKSAQEDTKNEKKKAVDDL